MDHLHTRVKALLKAAGQDSVRRAASDKRAHLSHAYIAQTGANALATTLLENALGYLTDEQRAEVLEFHERRLNSEWREPGEDDKYRQDGGVSA